jgi:hypothetical protein
MIRALVEALPDHERCALLAEHGHHRIGAGGDALHDWATTHPDLFLSSLAARPSRLALAFGAVSAARYPGRSEALLGVARALRLRLPESEYALPEEALDALLARARAIAGRRIPTTGSGSHKGRVGDGVERLLVGKRVRGRAADHAAAEIKSVPVSGDRVIERVKLGMVSARSNPLDKCGRVLFVFVERRGRDHFVRGHRLWDFSQRDFDALWRDGWLVETAAGTTARRAKGLYLVPKWFRTRGLWPPT